MSQQLQTNDTRGAYSFHPYYAQPQPRDQTRHVSRYTIRRGPLNKPPSALEKFRRTDYGKDGEYLAWVINTLRAPDTNEPQRLQLDPEEDLGHHGGGSELGHRVFGWMLNPRYDESIYNALEMKNKKQKRD